MQSTIVTFCLDLAEDPDHLFYNFHRVLASWFYRLSHRWRSFLVRSVNTNVKLLRQQDVAVSLHCYRCFWGLSVPFVRSLCSGFMEWIASSIFPVTLEVTFKAPSNSFSNSTSRQLPESLPKYFSLLLFSVSAAPDCPYFVFCVLFLTRNVRERAASHEEAEGSGR